MRAPGQGGGLDFPQEALRAQTGRQLGVQDLQGDREVVAEIAREVHGRHAAAAQLALQV